MEGKKETVNIIYVSNDGYARHLAASLYSLLAHSRKIRDLDVWVLSSGMCAEYQKRLQAVAEKIRPHRSGEGAGRSPEEISL